MKVKTCDKCKATIDAREAGMSIYVNGREVDLCGRCTSAILKILWEWLQ